MKKKTIFDIDIIINIIKFGIVKFVSEPLQCPIRIFNVMDLAHAVPNSLIQFKSINIGKFFG